MSSPQPTRFRCLVCHQSFGRIEHLTRHSRSHSKERYLKCIHCQKGFYRLDALRRHELVHDEPKRSSLGRGGRACVACAGAKRKCTGGKPCGSCEKRGTECSYESGRSAETNERNTATSSHGHSVAASNESPLSSTRQHGQNFGKRLHQQNDSSGSYITDDKYLSGGDSTTSQSQQANYQGGSPNHRASGSLVVDDNLGHLDVNRAAGSPGIWPLSGDTDIDMSATVNSMSESVTRSWSSTNQYSINWLPDDWLPGFSIELGHGSLAMQPSFSNSSHHVQPQMSPIGNMSSTMSSCFSLPHSASDQNSSPESQNVGETATGRYYVDGEGARLPHVLKTPHRTSEYPQTASREQGDPDMNAPFEFIRSHYSATVSFNVPLLDISEENYSTIYQSFDRTCVNTSQFRAFGTDNFPSQESLRLFLTLYLDRFQPVLPFIHLATFSPSRCHWLIILAMASIGSYYVEEYETERVSWAMHEFLRRAISIMVEAEEIIEKEYRLLIQVKILSCIGMLYSGHQRLTENAQIYFGDLVNFCKTSWDVPDVLEAHNNDTSVERWLRWAEAESRRRTGYSIWLLDCMWAIHLQTRPILCLEDAKIPMPCQEVLWEAKSELDWEQLYSVSTPSPPLHEAIQLLYVEKRLQSSTGEFSRILCIHALIRRTWEIETYLKQPLALWTPTAEKQDITSIESTPIWLPDIPTYQKWRNSACDCLDTLHWHANSVIGAASGLEHPTVLHLHLARVILLTPIREIVQLAHGKTSNRKGKSKSGEDVDGNNTLEKHVRRWATEDQYKARLAIIHAGVLLWHVRRYSIDAFYEPPSVFLATLALWAYGTFAKTTPRVEGVGEREEEDGGFPTSMQLDRPADDELVQLFVKRGAGMRALIMGVGDLCKRNGPRRVLGEGAALAEGAGWAGRGLGRRLRALGEVCAA